MFMITALSLAAKPDWQSWLANLGHDTYSYPAWVDQQMAGCRCRPEGCADHGAPVQWRQASALSFCTAKSWLLEHMPEFDLHYLPGSVTVNATSMLDDTIAFALMADRAASFSSTVPLPLKYSYILPFGSYHESRQNWRPLFFAKYFSLVQNATTVDEALGALSDVRRRVRARRLFTTCHKRLIKRRE